MYYGRLVIQNACNVILCLIPVHPAHTFVQVPGLEVRRVDLPGAAGFAAKVYFVTLRRVLYKSFKSAYHCASCHASNGAALEVQRKSMAYPCILENLAVFGEHVYFLLQFKSY